jgi:hypothetical protein
MARLAGLEPATLGFEARYSIQLSYRRSDCWGGYNNRCALIRVFIVIIFPIKLMTYKIFSTVLLYVSSYC